MKQTRPGAPSPGAATGPLTPAVPSGGSRRGRPGRIPSAPATTEVAKRIAPQREELAAGLFGQELVALLLYFPQLYSLT
jgi:hypothetical protein